MRKEYRKHFSSKKRDNGEWFYYLSEDAPDDLRELIYEIHCNFSGYTSPNDWIYATIFDAFNDLNNDDIDSIIIEADPYYSYLISWLSNSFASYMCDEYLKEFSSHQATFYSIVEGAQCMAKDRIYHAVNDFIQCEQE